MPIRVVTEVFQRSRACALPARRCANIEAVEVDLIAVPRGFELYRTIAIHYRLYVGHVLAEKDWNIELQRLTVADLEAHIATEKLRFAWPINVSDTA